MWNIYKIFSNFRKFLKLYLDELGTGLEKIFYKEIVDLREDEVLGSVEGPLHVVPDAVVEACEVLLGDDVVTVQVQNVIEEVPKLLLLKFWEQFPS